jgi:DNA-binding PadR family transcriptional regulator
MLKMHLGRLRDRRFARDPFAERGRGWHGGRHGRGGGRGGRIFDHGDLRLVILRLIAERPRYGYELIKTIEDEVGGAYAPSPGIVYPTLTLLEETGLATVTTDPAGKKLYEATEAGRASLAESAEALAAIGARIERARVHRGGPPPQIVRAMENLKTSLRLRLAEGEVGEDRVRAMAAVIDRAATEIDSI